MQGSTFLWIGDFIMNCNLDSISLENYKRRAEFFPLKLVRYIPSWLRWSADRRVSILLDLFMRNSAGNAHSGKLTVDEDDTFVYAIGSDEAPLDGKIISADNTYSFVSVEEPNQSSNEK